MDILSSKIIATRKEHRCWGCAEKFPKGSKMQSITNVDGGDIHTSYWCSVCQEYWNEHMGYGDEIGYGELKSEDQEGWEVIRESLECVSK